MIKIVWDLDGVLRELNKYLVKKYKMPYPTIWGWTFNDKDIYQLVKEDDYKALVDSPKTEYVNLIKENFDKVEIWTCQPKEWRKLTETWINENIKCDVSIFYLDTAQKRRKLNSEPSTILIEDNPNFTNYERIILIDKPYNREIEDVKRIFSAKELEKIIKLVKHESLSIA